MTEILTEWEIIQACRELRKILETGEREGEFNIANKVFVEVFKEPRRQ